MREAERVPAPHVAPRRERTPALPAKARHPFGCARRRRGGGSGSVRRALRGRPLGRVLQRAPRRGDDEVDCAAVEVLRRVRWARLASLEPASWTPHLRAARAERRGQGHLVGERAERLHGLNVAEVVVVRGTVGVALARVAKRPQKEWRQR
eukprot:3910637-Prymnesium_polylepis.1